MRIVTLAFASLTFVAPALRAQDPAPAPAPPPAPAPAAEPQQDNAIRPGMSETDVRARWGEPVAVKRANDWTYMFYRNYNERAVGFYDTVFLQRNQVVDVVARGDGRTYIGNSSSPGNRAPEFTPPTTQP